MQHFLRPGLESFTIKTVVYEGNFILKFVKELNKTLIKLHGYTVHQQYPAL